MSNTTLDILRPRSHLITVLSDTYIHILHTYYNESMHKSIDQCNWFWIYSCIFFAFSLQYLRNTPLYNFFHKKISYRTFWCIMSLTKKHYRGKWFCTIKTLYNEKTLIGRLRQYFLIYFETFSVPTADSLFLLILSILALESAHSIRFLYHYFLSGITKRSLNVFYYACSYAKVDYSRFMNTTVRITLKLIPDSLQTQPVFLCVDDTMVSKFGTKFENVSKLFDHAAHNGSNYLNGHCFVSVMLCVPVWNGDKVYYLSLTFCFEYSSNNWLAL